MTEYNENECAWFHKVKEQYGGLSNMAAGYPITVRLPDGAEVEIPSSEALYQVMKLGDSPEAQQEIISAGNGYLAKRAAYRHSRDFYPDWTRVSIAVMKWCISMKLLRNRKFGDLLLSTGDLPIVEKSTRDAFWGAKPAGDGILSGGNNLGILLTELRDEYRSLLDDNAGEMRIHPVEMDGFRILGQEVGIQHGSV